jgi:Na+/H+ antiporter
MNEIDSLIFLLGAAALLAQLARVLKVPYPILLVLGGLGIGFIPGLPVVQIAPEVIFVVFLPPLLNAAAFSASPLDLRAHLRPIMLLAIGLVLLTTLAVATIVLAGGRRAGPPAAPPPPPPPPPDPVAAEAIFRRLGVPQRVGTVVGGESLINDGTGLVAFRVALAALGGGAFSLWEAGLNFVLIGGGGIVVGLVLAWVILPLWGRLREPSIMITFSVLIPYGVYILAEEALHVSGILAVVTYGLAQGWRAPRLFPDASTRIQALSFWEVLVFVLEALLFILVGQQLPNIVGELSEYSFGQVLFYAALVYAAVLGARFAWFFSIPYLNPVFDRLLHHRYLRAPWQERLVMSWSGMRGAVSLAAALAVPVTIDGARFELRDLILFLTFAVILATLVLQGLTLGPLIRYLRLKSDTNAGTLMELRARLEGSRAALQKLEQLCADELVPQGAQEQMREHYEGRIRRYEDGIEAGGATEEYSDSSAAWRNWRRDLIGAEREAILSLRDSGDISPEVMRRIERDLDLEESRIGG